MNHINLSAAYTRATRLCQTLMTQEQPEAAVLQQLLQHLHQCAVRLQQQCRARGLANIIWSCAYLDRADTVQLLLPQLLQDSKLQQAGPQAVANALWACATMKVQLVEDDVQKLVQRLVQLLPQANPQDVSNTLWACATRDLQLADDDVQQLVQRFVQLLPLAKPQNVSNALWACATMKAQLAAADVQQLVQRFVQVLPQANPQNVSNTLWACATLDLQLADDDVQQLGQRFVQLLPLAKPQEVSNTLWACATMKVQLAAADVQQLVQRFVQVLPQANPQEVSNTLWARATLKLQLADGVVQQLVQRFVQLLPQAKPQELSNTLWACGHMQYAPSQLLSALDQRTLLHTNLLAAAVPQDLANMAWACGQLGYSGKLLPGVLLQLAVQLLQDNHTSSCNLQHLCNLCWTAAVLDLRQYVPQVLHLAAACKHMWGDAVYERLQQLYQVHLWLLDSQLPAPGQGLLGVLAQQQLRQCKDSWEQSLTASTSSAKASDLHRSVFAAVQALPAGTWQQPPVLEQRTADGALSIDIAATISSGVRLAIEVDGPSHFVRPNSTFTGPTLFRNRALAARGYVVVSIPYWEWRELRGATQKQQYLLPKVQAAAASGSSTAHQH